MFVYGNKCCGGMCVRQMNVCVIAIATAGYCAVSVQLLCKYYGLPCSYLRSSAFSIECITIEERIYQYDALRQMRHYFIIFIITIVKESNRIYKNIN